MQNTAYMINCTCMMIEYILKTIHYLISRMSLREFLVSVAFKINVRITLKMLHTPIRNDVNLYQSSDFGEISLDNANDTPYKRHQWEYNEAVNLWALSSRLIYVLITFILSVRSKLLFGLWVRDPNWTIISDQDFTEKRYLRFDLYISDVTQ